MKKPKKIKEDFTLGRWEKLFDNLLSNIPSDEEINNGPCPYYAKAYYQGKFDILMDLRGNI